MKRLLQRTQDGLYYRGEGMWTSDPDLALQFRESSAAIECCLRDDLPAVQMVLKFEDSAFDLRIACWPPATNPPRSQPTLPP